MNYTLHYQVQASTAYEAIVRATQMLRTAVVVKAVTDVFEYVSGWWEVTFDVVES